VAGRLATIVAALVLCAAVSARGQQGSVQLTSETQIVASDPSRRTGEPGFLPDFGINWLEPKSRYGQFQMEVHGAGTGDGVQLGRTAISVRDLKSRGFQWTFDAGDTYSVPGTDYQFSNLSAPSITFRGGSILARGTRTTFQVLGGQSTALRNVFGSDPDALGQTLAIARVTYQASDRYLFNGRAARTRTWDLEEFARTVDASDQSGLGARIVASPVLQFVVDGSYVHYRATGASSFVSDYSYLVGTHLLLSRGWMQVNASRYSPGDLPVLNAALQDRSGIFSAGEYDVMSRLRVFGGWERINTNINPYGTAQLRPEGTVDRGYGGARVQIGGRSSFTLRVEDGGRLWHPAIAATKVTQAFPATSDTGVLSAEWQSSLKALTVFGRYSRRDNIDTSSSGSSYTQHDSSGQVFLNVSRHTQIFGVATVTEQAFLDGNGSTFLQFTGGGQQQILERGLWMRLEGTVTRNHDRLTDVLAPRDAMSAGLNGQLTRQTSIGFNVYLDRAPAGFVSPENGWLTRSTLRVVHTIPTGSARVDRALSDGRVLRGSGSVMGSVFADWNGNGIPDAGEEALANIPVHLGSATRVNTARDGQFSFLNVPAGPTAVGVDVNALPVDFDPPAAADMVLELSRGETRRVAFALIPLGGIRGRVIEDANRNGQADVNEPGIEAVLTLDNGSRSEMARKGAFRFDAVRSGDHHVELLKESLPDGAIVTGGTDRDVSITREHPQNELTYLVIVEKRPEVRKVFPPRVGANTPGRGTSAPSTPHVSRPSPAANAPGRSSRTNATTPASAPDLELFTIQIAALNDSARARNIVEGLKGSGFDAYLVEPGDQHGPYRVRVGRFESRDIALKTVSRLEALMGAKAWLTTVTAR